MAAAASPMPDAAYAATFSLSSTGQSGSLVSVAPGVEFTVNVLMNAAEVGNTFEVFVGFDVSSETSPGLGGTPTVNKIALASTLTEIADSIDAGFGVFRSAKIATAREETNISLGGRPYGLKIVGARLANTAGGQVTLCSIDFVNNMPAGQSYFIVISDAGEGTSYTSAWKYGVTSVRGSYVLEVQSTQAALPGDANSDGVVNQLDLNVVIDNWQAGGVGWSGGDFNGDGVVNQLDLNIIIDNWQSTSSIEEALAAVTTGSTSESSDVKSDDGEDTVLNALPCMSMGMLLMLTIAMATLLLGYTRRRSGLRELDATDCKQSAENGRGFDVDK